MLDADLAGLYGVPTRRLNEQVKRNRGRFPADFMFQLDQTEKDELVANCDRLKNLKHSVALPYAFTEHGTLMLANVLKSQKAVEVSLFIVRAFIRLRRVLGSHKELAHKLEELEGRIQDHDESIRSLVQAIRELMAPPPKEGHKIGFNRPEIEPE